MGFTFSIIGVRCERIWRLSGATRRLTSDYYPHSPEIGSDDDVFILISSCL